MKEGTFTNNTISQELSSLKEQLLHAEKLASIGQLAAGVAHEINNPIGYVASNITILAKYIAKLNFMIQVMSQSLPIEQFNNIKRQYDYDYIYEDLPILLKQSEEGLNRVIEIISALKDFSHIDDNEFIAGDVIECIESTLIIFASEVKFKATVNKKLSDLPLVACIPSQINQVILNLLMNALHATGPQGVITIETGYDEKWVWFSIRDNGHGIDKDQLSLIFQPFYTTKPKGEGTGLGLALSFEIIQKHGGFIDVNSEVGVGSCFTVKLPNIQI